MQHYDITIIGGGMVGLAFALSINNKKSLKIAIIDPNIKGPLLHKDFHIRVSAITLKSECFLKNIGAWDFIKRKQSFVSTNVWDQNSHGRLNFNSIDDGLSHLGHIIENDYIKAALLTALQKTNVKLIHTKLNTITAIQNYYQLNLDSNEQILTDLLVGADGVNSRIRGLADIKFNEYNYQQQAIVCNIKSQKSFENKTWQRFLADSIIALLPLGDKQASIVWSANNVLADELTGLPVTEFADKLAASVEYKFGNFKITSNIKTFNIVKCSAKQYFKKNIVLIGDAAHNIHPLAGQGVNLGFADANELKKQIVANLDTSIGYYEGLKKYARIRQFNDELMAKTMSGLNCIYKVNNEPLRLLRGCSMNLINKSPTLKSFLQQYAINL